MEVVRDVLVGKTLAALVEVQPRLSARPPDVGQTGGVRLAHVQVERERSAVKRDAAGMVAVDVSTGPQRHLDAVAHGERAAHVVDDGVLVAVVERLHHLRVAAVAAGGEDDALGGVDLDVSAVSVALHDDAGHLAVFILNELLGGMQEELGHAHLLGILHPDRVGELAAHVVRAKLLEFALAEDGMGLHFALVDGLLHIGLDEHIDVLGGHLVHEPVHRTAGVVDPQGDQALVNLVAAVAADIVDDLVELFLGVLDAIALLHDLGVVGADFAGPGDRAAVLFNPDDLRAQIRSGNRRDAAAVAGADDDDFSLDHFSDVGDGGRLGKVLLVVPLAGARRFLSLGFGRHIRHAHGAHGQRAQRRALEKTSAGKFVFHNRFILS